MKLRFIKAQEIDRNVKCAIHKNGKMGFSSAAIKKLKVDTNKSIRIAVNDDDPEDGNLYVMIEEGLDEDAFKINKAGNYYYVNTKVLFDNLNIDYRTMKVIYDIVDFEYEGMKMFKFIKRELKRTNQKRQEKRKNEEEE